MSRSRLRLGLSIAVLMTALLATASLGACSSDQREFSADDFVHDANRHGAELKLGEPLSAGDSDAELYALSFRGMGAGPAPEGSGGSLRVTDSSSDAEGEFSRCQEAGLICYRAANVVLALQEGAEPRNIARLGRAVKAMQKR
jgi:hypothetical protein